MGNTDSRMQSSNSQVVLHLQQHVYKTDKYISMWCWNLWLVVCSVTVEENIIICINFQAGFEKYILCFDQYCCIYHCYRGLMICKAGNMVATVNIKVSFSVVVFEHSQWLAYWTGFSISPSFEDGLKPLMTGISLNLEWLGEVGEGKNRYCDYLLLQGFTNSLNNKCMKSLLM